MWLSYGNEINKNSIEYYSTDRWEWKIQMGTEREKIMLYGLGLYLWYIIDTFLLIKMNCLQRTFQMASERKYEAWTILSHMLASFSCKDKRARSIRAIWYSSCVVSFKEHFQARRCHWEAVQFDSTINIAGATSNYTNCGL